MKPHKQKNNRLFKFVFEDYTDIRIVYTLQGYRYVRILGYLYLRIGKHGGYYAK